LNLSSAKKIFNATREAALLSSEVDLINFTGLRGTHSKLDAESNRDSKESLARWPSLPGKYRNYGIDSNWVGDSCLSCYRGRGFLFKLLP
jgi:hypothetical protein